MSNASCTSPRGAHPDTPGVPGRAPAAPAPGHLLAACCAALVLAGCAVNGGPPTQAEVDRANQVCTAQGKSEQAALRRNWFTRWLQCQQELRMPLEIRAYPGKEQPIREMYAKLLAMGTAVDAGRSRVEPIYEEWDRMRAEIGMYRGVCVKNPDGSQRCINPKGDSLFFHTSDGDIVPIR